MHEVAWFYNMDTVHSQHTTSLHLN